MFWISMLATEPFQPLEVSSDPKKNSTGLLHRKNMIAGFLIKLYSLVSIYKNTTVDLFHCLVKLCSLLEFGPYRPLHRITGLNDSTVHRENMGVMLYGIIRYSDVQD
ncbi:hypothetical protein ABZP36_033388 [Zizania latifolia]